MHLSDERDAVLSADLESLVAPERQQIQEVLTVRASGLNGISSRTLGQRHRQVAIARQTTQRLIVRADRDVPRSLVASKQLEGVRLVVRAAADAHEVQLIVRVGIVEDPVAVQTRPDVRSHQLPAVRHALSKRKLEALISLRTLDRDSIAAVGMEEHVRAGAVVERELTVIARVEEVVGPRIRDHLRRIPDRAGGASAVLVDR